MSKLDEQGLSTLVTELDKHINTKINGLSLPDMSNQEVLAENVTILDAKNLFVATNVEDALSENREDIEINKVSILSIQEELGVNKTTLEANINEIREVL